MRRTIKGDPGAQLEQKISTGHTSLGSPAALDNVSDMPPRVARQLFFHVPIISGIPSTMKGIQGAQKKKRKRETNLFDVEENISKRREKSDVGEQFVSAFGSVRAAPIGRDGRGVEEMINTSRQSQGVLNGSDDGRR